MSLAAINAAIAARDPFVELVRAPEGYHYFIWDTSAEGKRDGFFETISVMVPYTSQLHAQRWIDDGVKFGREMVSRYAEAMLGKERAS